MNVLVISDLHVGSKYGLMPRRYKNILARKPQRLILKKWVAMCKNEKPDYTIINGDSVDGKGYASNGKECWTTDLHEQIEAAKQLVCMINCDKFYVAYGSRYHTDENLNADEEFADKLGAKAKGWELSFQPEKIKVPMHFSHKISVSTSTWQYRTTPLAKELVALLLNANVLPKYKVIGRAHAHYFCQVSFTTNMAFVNPCWQLRTPYMIRKGLALIPKMGYTVLESEDGEHWSLRAETFDIPKPVLVG